jgi:hypothetical protein
MQMRVRWPLVQADSSRTPSNPQSKGVAYGIKRCCPRMGTAPSGRIAALDRGKVWRRVAALLGMELTPTPQAPGQAEDDSPGEAA